MSKTLTLGTQPEQPIAERVLTRLPSEMLDFRTVAALAKDAQDYARIEHEVWDNNGLGNAIPGATPRAAIDVRTLIPGVPLLANMTEFGRTPYFSADQFESMGYRIVIWPVSSLGMKPLGVALNCW